MVKKFKEWFSIQYVQNPQKLILLFFVIVNIGMIILGSAIIKGLSLTGTESMPFLQAVFCTISMMLDPGCISFVVEDIGESGVVIAFICFIIVIFGMVSFSGSVIGYVTNRMSAIIEESNSSDRTLHLTEHFVILNWNNRAAEIINDLLYLKSSQKVIVLVAEGKDRIEHQIQEKVHATIHRENALLTEKYAPLPVPRSQLLKNNLTVIVREGDVFSHRQLLGISINQAKSIVILGADENQVAQDKLEDKRGNVNTIKTLMQVSDLTASESSSDNQSIIVEVTDDWTLEQVQQIIEFKQVQGKCNITPLRINQVLGQILSQFTVLPELNQVYSELFSNYGATIYAAEHQHLTEDYLCEYMADHHHAIPLVLHTHEERALCYYIADSEKDIFRESHEEECTLTLDLHERDTYPKKTIIIIGQNSRYAELMEGYRAYLHEWPDSAEIIVIDDKASLEKVNYYREYPFVTETFAIGDYDRVGIRTAIDHLLDKKENEISILILSDDQVDDDSVDSMALSNLIFIQTIINNYKKTQDADRQIDVIVELLDPKHHEIVTRYNVDNVVISNRYISKMVTQIGEKEALYNFFEDILTYDQEGVSEFVSKEIYVRRASDIFRTLPPKTTAHQLIRAISSTPDEGHTVPVGYIRSGQDIVMFHGDLTQIPVELRWDDKLILFSAHV